MPRYHPPPGGTGVAEKEAGDHRTGVGIYTGIPMRPSWRGWRKNRGQFLKNGLGKLEKLWRGSWADAKEGQRREPKGGLNKAGGVRGGRERGWRKCRD